MDESLVEAIFAAFPPSEPPPRPVTGHRCPECDDVDRLLGGRRWTDVAADFPHYCYDAFPLLTPAAKVYYLPAYLVFEVRSPGYMPGVSVTGALERGDLRPDAFTPSQRAAVLRWAEAYYRRDVGGEVPDWVRDVWAGDCDRPT